MHQSTPNHSDHQPLINLIKHLFSTRWVPATAALAALLLTSTPAHAGAVWNVNLDSITSRTNLVGPAGGSGKTWNQINAFSAANLLDADNAPTTVGFTLSSGYFGSWGSPGLTLLNGAYYLGGTTSSNLVITGLSPVKTYDLYLPSYSAYGSGMWNMGFSTLNTTATTSPQMVVNSGNSSTWVQGDNFARFTGMVPDASGQITVSMAGQSAYSFLCGFQILETGSVPAMADILTFGLPGNPAVINGTNINMVVPAGTSVTNLAPTFTLSPGATCVPVSGTARDFSSPQTYAVTSLDPLIAKTYTVTVDVLEFPDQSFHVNLDGSPSRTGLVGPAGGSGETWNQSNAYSASNLLNADNVQTTVGFTLGSGYFGSWGAPGLTLLNGSYFLGGGGTSSNLVITGLVPARTYDLFLASFSAYNGGAWNMSFSTLNTTPTTSPQTVNSTAADGSTWLQGANYARFTSIKPDAAGNITVSMTGTGAYSFFSGFQLVDKTPQAFIKSFTFPGIGDADIFGSSISITVPYGTDLTTLAPTYTLSDGASCVPASGSSQDFTNPVQYQVTASDLTTKNYTVTVNPRPIADPQFTLTAPATWDGRQTITVQSTITNQAQLEATGGTAVNERWSVGGVAAIQQIAPGILTLSRSQGSGPMVVTLTMDNGGFPISHSVTIQVQEPATDPWVERTPGADEKPVEGQFFARNPSTNLGTIHYNGTESGAVNSVYLKVYKTPSGGSETLDDTHRQTLEGTSYALSAPITAGLITYRVVYGTTTRGTDTDSATVTDLVCGDAYIINGQSNAVALADDGDAPPDDSTSPWIRTYVRSEGTWSYARGEASEAFSNSNIGLWAMPLARDMVANHQMPVCMINGAVGGTRIDQHQPNPANHTVGAGIYDLYANLLNRVVAARLTHGIRGVFWHQGENNSGDAGPMPEADYLSYQQLFLALSSAWKQDYPNLQRYIIFQVMPRPCAMGPYGDQLREAQRTLPFLYSRMSILNTLGFGGDGGCHFTKAGYESIADRVLPVVSRDYYGTVPGGGVTAPNLLRAYFTSTARTAIALEFDQAMSWSSFSMPNYYVDDVGGKVSSGSASGNIVTLQLSSAAAANATLDYLKDSLWNLGESVSSLLYGANGIPALTFADVPVGVLLTPYDTWAGGSFANSFTDTTPTGDPDFDGQDNQEEFAFGLDPTTGSSANPITQQLDKATGIFKYTRTKDSGLTYKVYYSTDLSGWTLDASATQTPAAAVAGVETVTVTLAVAPPPGGKLFVRVEASQSQ